MKGFRDFILRGNVIDLAIAIVIGIAFGNIVTALVKDLITPLIAAIGGQPDFSAITFTINNSKLLIGDFVIIAAVIYFLVLLPVNKMLERFKPTAIPVPDTTRECPMCKSSGVAKTATRCPYCTSTLEPVQ